MDEPTDGLDPNQKHQVRKLIEEMAKEKAIIISTHILEEVEAVCTRAVIINQGRIVADGTAEDLMRRVPYHMPSRSGRGRPGRRGRPRRWRTSRASPRSRRIGAANGQSQLRAVPKNGRAGRHRSRRPDPREGDRGRGDLSSSAASSTTSSARSPRSETGAAGHA